MLVDGGMVNNSCVRIKEDERSYLFLSSDEDLRLRGEFDESWTESWSGGETVENRRLRGDIGLVWHTSGTDVVISGRTIDCRLPGLS